MTITSTGYKPTTPHSSKQQQLTIPLSISLQKSADIVFDYVFSRSCFVSTFRPIRYMCAMRKILFSVPTSRQTPVLFIIVPRTVLRIRVSNRNILKMSTSSFKVQEHVLPTQYVREYPGSTLLNQEDELKIHIKQYTPLGRKGILPGAITIIGAHANGFPKELYEPLWEDLYHILEKRGHDIQSIWIADVAHQGTSGVLNQQMLGNDPGWNDHARDLLHMVNHFRGEMPRPLVGIGHSMGGHNLVNLSLFHPRLLSTLILVDPIIQGKALAQKSSSYDTTNANPRFAAARSSTFRRDKWPSRAEAAAAFARSKFYQSWDPRVFDRWIQYGLRDLPSAVYPNIQSESTGCDHPVTLTTSKHQEVFTFLRPNFVSPFSSSSEVIIDRAYAPDLDPEAEDIHPFYRPESPVTFDQLPHLRPSALYIFGGKSPMSPPEVRKAKMQRTGIGVGGSGGQKEGRVKEYVLTEGDHLMPMQQVADVAEATGGWLVEEVERWRRGEEEWAKQWAKKSVEEKTMITEEWEDALGGNPRGSKQPKL